MLTLHDKTLRQRDCRHGLSCVLQLAAIKGTSRPTEYNVLIDQNSFTLDGLEAFTNE